VLHGEWEHVPHGRERQPYLQLERERLPAADGGGVGEGGTRRGGGAAGRRYPWGDTDEIDASRANYDGDYGGTTPVGSFAPNGYGLYDMAGNVWEWCWDWYGSKLPGGVDPCGPASAPASFRVVRVLRGGDWDSSAYCCRVAYRYGCWPDCLFRYRGFRLVRTAP